MLHAILKIPLLNQVSVSQQSTLRQRFILTLMQCTLNQFQTQSLILLFDNQTSGFQYKTQLGGITQGIDGFSLWLIFLVNQIIPVVIQGSYKQGQTLYSYFIQLKLQINFFTQLVFKVLDVQMFYISFEAVQIPMYFQIALYGSRNKKLLANYLFILYTQFGSLFQLQGIQTLFVISGTTDYLSQLHYDMSSSYQSVLFLLFFIAFAIKLPKQPFHIWLPIVHTESPTGGSVIQAAILLKLGTYGLIRYSLPQFPAATELFTPQILTLAQLSVVYASQAAFSQIDQKQIIAYSSIIHMNLSLVGLQSNNIQGICGSYFYSITHGQISSALFLLVGALYERYHTRTMQYFRGLVQIKPVFSKVLFYFTLSNISFPKTPGFIPELKVYFGSIEQSPLVLFQTTSVIIQLPLYFVKMYQRISFGTLSPYKLTIYTDQNIKELLLYQPLFIFSVILSISPNMLLNTLFYPTLQLLY